MSATKVIRLWLLSALVIQIHEAVGGNPDAKRLYDDLLSNYNKLVRPVVNTTDVLKVCIKLKLSQLIDVVSSIPGIIVQRQSQVLHPRGYLMKRPVGRLSRSRGSVGCTFLIRKTGGFCCGWGTQQHLIAISCLAASNVQTR